MPGNKEGFSVIELMVVVLLIGLMATITIPNLQRLAPSYQRAQFIDRCSMLLAMAWQHALTSQRVHRVFFDFKELVMRVEVETDEQKENKPVFKMVTRMYEKTEFSIPASLKIKQFYIEGQEQLERQDIKTTAAWFYIVPDGLAQSVIMNILDTSEQDEQGKAFAFSLVVNPFNARITVYETFQKP